MTHIGALQQGRVDYSVNNNDPNIFSEDTSSLSPHGASYFTNFSSRISQQLKDASSSALRNVLHAVNFGKELSARAIECASTILSNNQENIRSALLATTQMTDHVARLAADQGRHALAALGYASLQAGETIVDSAKRLGPNVGNALLNLTTQAAHSATRFAADQGPAIIKAIEGFGIMSAQATGSLVAAARRYGPEMVDYTQRMPSTRELEDVSSDFLSQRSIRMHDSNNTMIEMSPLAGMPQSASLEVIDDEENEIGDLQSAKALREDADPLLGRTPLTRSPSSRQDTAIASQSQTLNADTQAEQSSAPHSEPAPVSKSSFKRYFTSVQNGLATISNGARTVVFTIANALLSVVTFKWLRGH